MGNSKQHLVGSYSRDAFKFWHKEYCPAWAKRFWACDLDFILVDKNPSRIVAAIDFKLLDSDRVNFSEVIAYNSLVACGILVYIVEANIDGNSSETNHFTQFYIWQYLGGDMDFPPNIQRKDIFINGTEDDYWEWERKLRERS